MRPRTLNGATQTTSRGLDDHEPRYWLLFVILFAFANPEVGVTWRQVVGPHHLKPSAA